VVWTKNIRTKVDRTKLLEQIYKDKHCLNKSSRTEVARTEVVGTKVMVQE